MDAHQQDLVAQFCVITAADPASAQNALASANWNLEEAVGLYYAANDEGPQNQEESDTEEEQVTPAQPSAPQTQSQASSSRPLGQRPKQMTLDDLKKIQEADDDDDDEDKKPDMFAGGEKSGLAVQNPNQGQSGGPVNHFKNIMNQARQNRERPGAAGEELDRQPQASTNFSGRAQTLGGDDAESRVVEDPTEPQKSRRGMETVNRTMHLWADGVSIDDGPLFRFDDPANANMMAEINRGMAPLALLDVRPDQEVDLNLEPHKDENYVQPKKKYQAFGGSGQRLGAPTPGPGPSSSSTTTTAPAAQSNSSSTNQGSTVDETQPVIQLQIRLADGTRLPSRFNTNHTIGDVYEFVNAAQASNQQRPYVLMTTFPSKELSDKGAVLGDMGEFKRGGVVVQKWT